MNQNINDSKLDLISFLESDHRKLLRPNEVSKILGISTETVYDWKYRAKKRGIPDGLFIKISTMLFVRSDLLKQWISGQMHTSISADYPLNHTMIAVIPTAPK